MISCNCSSEVQARAWVALVGLDSVKVRGAGEVEHCPVDRIVGVQPGGESVERGVTGADEGG
jgi:hypothetical protein